MPSTDFKTIKCIFLIFINSSTEDLRRSCLLDIAKNFPADSLSEYVRKIGLKETDYHEIKTSSIVMKPYTMLNRWTQRCGNWLTGYGYCRTKSVLVYLLVYLCCIHMTATFIVICKQLHVLPDF